MSKRTNYDESTKAAVIAALLEGQGVTKVAKEYNIPIGTIRSWKSRMQPGTVASGKQEEIGKLLVEYLALNLKALQAQTAVFSDPDWIKKQGANEMAILHGVMTDKAVRLMEAMAPAEVEN